MIRSARTLLIAGATAAALLGGACSTGDDVADPAATTSDTQVVIEDFVYSPAELTVAAGTTVSWTNEDFFGHTVTSGEPGDRTDRFDGVLGEVADAEGTGFSFAFDEPGTYTYFCRFHPRMLGTITVTA